MTGGALTETIVAAGACPVGLLIAVVTEGGPFVYSRFRQEPTGQATREGYCARASDGRKLAFMQVDGSLTVKVTQLVEDSTWEAVGREYLGVLIPK